MTAPAPERLAEMLAAVEMTEGPSRELDAEIDTALFGGEIVWKQTRYTMDQYPAVRRANNAYVGGFATEHVPLLTSSIDAALALVERVLPGWFWSVGFIDDETATQEHHKYGAVVHPHFHVADKRDGLGHGATPPLAILAALLRALITGAHHAD